MIPTAGTTHDLRVMLRAPRTQGENRRRRETLEDELKLQHESFTDKTPACESSAVSCFTRLKKTKNNFAQLISFLRFPATREQRFNKGNV